MSRSALGMMSDRSSGSCTTEQTARGQQESTSVSRTVSSLRQNRLLRDATLQMARGIKGIPQEIANRWYAFTRSECRYPQGHTMGNWPDFARAFAKKGARLSDVMAPAFEVQSQLKRDIYSAQIPSLQSVEAMEADVVCRIQKAEIAHDTRALIDAAREEKIVAELLEEAADREAVTLMGAPLGGSR